MKQRERFLLVVEADPTSIPAVARLKQLLKSLLRRGDFRCRSILPAKENEP